MQENLLGKNFDKAHSKRNSMLLAVKECLLYCPPWDQKEEAISFIMCLGRGEREEKNFTQ